MALPELLPFILGEFAPGRGTIVITGGTPVVNVSGSATITITGGTPIVIIPLAPTGATVSLTGGTSIVGTSALPYTLPWLLPGEFTVAPTTAVVFLTGDAVLLNPALPASALIYITGAPVLSYIPQTGTVALPWNTVIVSAESRQTVVVPNPRTVVA